MAEDITLNHGSATTVLTTELNSLADGDDAVTASGTDLGATSEMMLAVELSYTLAGAATGSVYVYLAWSGDNSAYSTVRSDETGANDELVMASPANGTTAVVCVVCTPVRARYVKTRVWNQAGAAFAATSNTVKIYPIAVDQA